MRSGQDPAELMGAGPKSGPQRGGHDMTAISSAGSTGAAYQTAAANSATATPAKDKTQQSGSAPKGAHHHHGGQHRATAAAKTETTKTGNGALDVSA
jgi:hypothetical protein